MGCKFCSPCWMRERVLERVLFVRMAIAYLLPQHRHANVLNGRTATTEEEV